MDIDLLKLVFTFSTGALIGGLTVHFFHIKITNQHSHGNKSPNTAGKDNQITIK